MSPAQIRNALTRRLAYLEAVLEGGRCGDRGRPHIENERNALQAVLEQLGLFNESAVVRRKAGVVSKVFPVTDRRHERARQAIRAVEAREVEPQSMSVAGHTEKLVVGLQRAVRVA